MTSELQNQHSSSRNAEKHDLLSNCVVLCGEDPVHFRKLIARLYDEFQPQSFVEEDLIDTMAVARWRQTRLWIIEKSAYDVQMSREQEQARSAGHKPATLCGLAFRTLSDNSRTLDLINRYESRFDRQYLRSPQTPPGPPETARLNSAKRTQARTHRGTGGGTCGYQPRLLRSHAGYPHFDQTNPATH
jgi:hypothetical protein